MIIDKLNTGITEKGLTLEFKVKDLHLSELNWLGDILISMILRQHDCRSVEELITRHENMFNEIPS